MRLIDADELKAKAHADTDSGEGFVWVQDIDEAPTVDAVEVVRCKDCKYRIYDDMAKEIWCNHSKGLSSVLSDTDFCSYGERRTDEAD